MPDVSDAPHHTHTHTRAHTHAHPQTHLCARLLGVPHSCAPTPFSTSPMTITAASHKQRIPAADALVIGWHSSCLFRALVLSSPTRVFRRVPTNPTSVGRG
jgi:hypothetical protein